GGHATIVFMLEKLLSCLLIWGLITIGYLFIPANRLAWRAVAPGALVATIALYLAHWGFRIYVEHAVVGSPAGSLGLVPLFLFWVYLNWMCLLFGLQCAAVTSRVAKVRRGRHQREQRAV
ncbi:MAG: YihY/virulence factor BrkB family protein, partial [Phycisphaerales bacterium]|nr:YihY/virulence factor BrkB family protein [Phycisphaerales bacterium]